MKKYVCPHCDYHHNQEEMKNLAKTEKPTDGMMIMTCSCGGKFQWEKMPTFEEFSDPDKTHIMIKAD